MIDKKGIAIDFSTLGGPVYIGRSRGDAVRLKLDLDKIDSSDVVVTVIIPDETYAINSSFFLGLFGKSIRAAGSREVFLDKFKFECNDIFLDVIETGIYRALQEKNSIF